MLSCRAQTKHGAVDPGRAREFSEGHSAVWEKLGRDPPALRDNSERDTNTNARPEVFPEGRPGSLFPRRGAWGFSAMVG